MQFIIYNNSINKKAIKISTTTKATKASTTLGQYIRFRLNNSYVQEYMHDCVWVCDNFHTPCAILICLRALGKSDAHVESQHTLYIWHKGYLQCTRRFPVSDFFINSYSILPKSVILVLLSLKFFLLFHSVIPSDNLKFILINRVFHSRSFMHLFAFFSYFFFVTGFCLCFFIHILNIFVYTQICANIYKRKRRNLCECERKRESDSEKKRGV